VDYFESSDRIGWLRQGNRNHPSGMAVTMGWSKDPASGRVVQSIPMSVGKQHAGETWTDLLELCSAIVVIDENGLGDFPCQQNSVAFFVDKSAPGRDRFPVGFNPDFFRL
jgi:alpha-amylase